MTTLLLDLLQDMALASVPAVGFALVFNVPREALKLCAAGGAIGHGLRFLLLKAGLPIELGTLIAAATVSFIGVWWAQRLRAHPKVFTVAAMIPMVPGLSSYTTLLALVEISRRGYTPELWSTAITNGLRAMFIVSALAVGLAAPGLLVFRRKPVV